MINALIHAVELIPVSIYFAFLVSLTVSLALVFTSRWHVGISADEGDGIQKMHLNITPRVGGLGVFMGVAASFLSASPEQAAILGPLWLAGGVAFLFGFLEDLMKKVSVATRLFATIFSGVLVWAITGVSIHRLGVSWVDSLLAIQVISVVFTAFAIGGIANSINIIDGLNGLASAMKVIAFTAIAIIAYVEGDTNLAFASLSIAAAVGGFFLVNWPKGMLFLGDGGSYFGGFALAWSAVLLIDRNQEVTPFAALLVCIYPFVEVLFSIYRRHVKKMPAGQPDNQHLHSLVYRRYIISSVPNVIENSIAGIMMAAVNIPPAIAAYWFRYSDAWAALACVGFSVLYILIYRRLVKFSWG